MKKSYGIFSLLLAVCMLFLFAIPSIAAGDGYSDIIRIYSLTGIDGKANINGIAHMHGKVSNKPVDNYVVLLKINTNTNEALMDTMNGDDFNQLVQTCISSSQLHVNNYNELLLSYGVPDEYLMLDEKPYVVSELEKAIAEKKTTATIQDNIVVTADAFKMAAANGVTAIHFDNVIYNDISVRISVKPANVTKGFATLANALTSDDDPTIQLMAKYYTNKFATVDFLQEGSFGTTVHVAAKPRLGGLDINNLEFYYYNIFTNSLSKLENTNYFRDERGFLHFDTSLGGTILITDRPLAKR